MPHPSADNEINIKRKDSLKNWWAGILYHTEKPVERSMLLFWLNFFSIEMRKTTFATRPYKYLDITRAYSLDSIHDMIVDTILSRILIQHAKKLKSPGMTLPGTMSEMLLKRIVGPGYDKYTSKEKIKRLKRLLNEWNLICDTLMANSRNHELYLDFDLIVFANITAVKEFIPELNIFIGKLLRFTPAALNISRKLFIWKNGRKYTDAEEETIILPASEVFESSSYNASKLCECIFQGKEDPVETPIDFVIRLVKKTNLFNALKPNDLANYPFYEWLRLQVEILGQDIMDIPPGTCWFENTLSPAQQLWLNSRFLNVKDEMQETIVSSLQEIKIFNRHPFSKASDRDESNYKIGG